MQYEEAADKLHALCARERTEEEDWKLNDNTYYSRIDEDDCMAFIVATVMTICKSLGIPERFSAMNRRGAPDAVKEFCVSWIEKIEDEEQQAAAMTYAMKLF